MLTSVAMTLEPVYKPLMRHNPALKTGSRCSFIPYKLRSFADFCRVLYSPKGFKNRLLRWCNVLLFFLVVLWYVGTEASPFILNQFEFYVDSYYGDYTVTKKQAGFPAKSLQGPRREKWIPPSPSKRGYRIGVLFPHLKDPYWRAVNYGIVTEAKRLKVGIRLLSAGGYEEIEKQKAQFEQLIQEKMDGIILASISYTALDELVENASRQGIPVIEVINDIYSPAIRAKALVSFYEMGYRAGEFVIADAAERSRVTVAFFPGPRGSGWAPETLKGFFKIQRDNPKKIKLYPPRWGDTDYDVQRRLIEEFLQVHSDVDYIVGNAVAAEVAIDVLKARGLSQQVRIVATYIIPTIYDKLKQGLIAAAPSDVTVAQGKMAIDMMVRLLDGEQPGKDFPFRSGPIIPVVTTDNISDFSYEEFFGMPDFQPVFEVEFKQQP